MKIGDIEVGKEYAVIDGKYSNDLPRQCKVIEIVKAEFPVWSVTHDEMRTHTKREVKIKLLDKSTVASSAWHRRLAGLKRGTVTIVPPRLITGLWATVRADVAKAIREEQERVDIQAKFDKRLRALKLGNSSAYVSDHNTVTLSCYGRDVEKILTLAEAGKLTNA